MFTLEKILLIILNSLVSIIIPTYNRAHLIGVTLDSILNQTYTNWECIVVDDGSTDETEALLQSYIEKDFRFKFYKRPINISKGANACRNYGFGLSKGTYINWFDSDDVMLPNKLELQVSELKDNPNAPYCICQTKWVDKNTNAFLGLRSKQISSKNRFEDYVLYNIFWSILAPVWQRDFITQYRLIFDETLHQSQEYDFHVKALAIDSNYIVVDEALASMYKHDTNLSNTLYTDVLKMESNIAVKAKIVRFHLSSFTSNGQLKFLEILTLFYKDLLGYKKLAMAKQVMPLMFATLKLIDLPFWKKTVFCSQLVLAYFSYYLTGRGYGIVTPITKF